MSKYLPPPPLAGGESYFLRFKRNFHPVVLSTCDKHIIEDCRLTGLPQYWEGPSEWRQELGPWCASQGDLARSGKISPEACEAVGLEALRDLLQKPREAAGLVLQWRAEGRGCRSAAYFYRTRGGRLRATVTGVKGSLSAARFLELILEEGTQEHSLYDPGKHLPPAKVFSTKTELPW